MITTLPESPPTRHSPTVNQSRAERSPQPAALQRLLTKAVPLPGSEFYPLWQAQEHQIADLVDQNKRLFGAGVSATCLMFCVGVIVGLLVGAR